MRKNLILTSLLICLGTVTSFAQMVGGDRDKHGCIGSAGYTYSNLNKECIRVFEQPIKVNNAFLKQSSTLQTAIIFSKNKNKAEIFVNSDEGIVLKRSGKKGKYMWKNSEYEVGNNKGYYIKKSGVMLYNQN